MERWINKWLDNMWGDEVRFLRHIAPHIPFVGKRFTAIIDAHWAERVADVEAFIAKLYRQDTDETDPLQMLYK